MAIFFVLITFILCWIWIELTLLISNRLRSANKLQFSYHRFIWYLRGIALLLLSTSMLYMYNFQNISFQKAIQYCLGIIR